MEQDILERIKDGDIKAFESLYKSYYAMLCTLAESIIHNHEIAEEIVDDIFFYIWDHHEELEIDHLRAYLFKSVRNNTEKTCKSLSFRQRKFTASLDDTFIRIHEYLSDSQHPLGWMLEKELENEIHRAISELPEECGKVFQLSRYEGKKYAEIAVQLGISPNTVKYHIKNAIKILSTKLLPIVLLFIIGSDK